MEINAPQGQVKSAKISRRIFTAGCVLVLAVFILAGVFGWNMICNVVAAVAIVNLGFGLYYGYKAERLTGMEGGQ